MRELNNERVDIIRWNEDVSEFVTEALKPAIVRSLSLDNENRVVNVTVDEEDLSKAIGRRGQNARLTSKLTGWDVQVRKDESQHEQFEARVDDAATHLAEDLKIDDATAGRLFRAGGVTVDMVAQMPASYIASAIEVDLEEATRILNAAKGEEIGPEASEVSEAPVEKTVDAEVPAEEAPEG